MIACLVVWMIDSGDPNGVRAGNGRMRAAAEAERLTRMSHLAPEVVDYWTKLIQRAALRVHPGKRPCDYDPWIIALREARGAPAFASKSDRGSRDYCSERYPDLMAFAVCASRPGWPEHRRFLIDFALTFLEADVMLFRSGYTKRHLARRLQQSRLSDADVRRVEAVLRRAVVDGAGLEEFRAYCRLAAHLVTTGRLPEIVSWLEDKADGALLTLDRAGGAMWRDIFDNLKLSDPDRRRFERVNWLGPSKWGVKWPEMQTVEIAGPRLWENAEMVRRNAYRMLLAIG